MDVFLSLSSEARSVYKGDLMEEGLGYMSSRFLASTFASKGHNLRVVHPGDVYDRNGEIFSKSTYSFKNNIFRLEEKDLPLYGDVFFVYGLGEETTPEISKGFLDLLYPLEKQVKLMLNSAEATSYEFKPKQKTLDLPWIYDFNVSSRKDLVDLLREGEKIIAKPNIGAAGQGITSLLVPDDVIKIPEENLGNYLFERFVPASEERRYIFLDNRFILGRKTLKKGPPGEEEVVGIDLMEGYANEIEIARNALGKTGMFFCAIDFRGDNLLEINGSGTGIAPPTVKNEMDSYNLSSPIVRAVERKFILENEK